MHAFPSLEKVHPCFKKYPFVAYKTILPLCYALIVGCDYIIAGTDYIIAGTDFIITAIDYRIIAGWDKRYRVGGRVFGVADYR